MYRTCTHCGSTYNDEFCSTVCPHRGIGFCAVCDCTLCICLKESCRDWERSTNGSLSKSEEVVGRVDSD